VSGGCTFVVVVEFRLENWIFFAFKNKNNKIVEKCIKPNKYPLASCAAHKK
jgi:hypothetical protein